MDYNEFKIILNTELKNNSVDIHLKEEELNQLYNYMQYILNKNNYVNLTSIVDQKEFIIKHIIDSLYIDKFIKAYKPKNSDLSLLDIGTGGGFPLVPIKILYKNFNAYGLDATMKKLKIIQDFDESINILHGRAEILAHDTKYRENFDIVVSRAVALIDNVIEYMTGFVKKGGILICMKGSEEYFSESFLNKMGVSLIYKEIYKIDGANRTIYIFEKITNINKNIPNKNSKYYKKRTDK